jgi:hypothetical protein
MVAEALVAVSRKVRCMHLLFLSLFFAHCLLYLFVFVALRVTLQIVGTPAGYCCQEGERSCTNCDSLRSFGNRRRVLQRCNLPASD